MDNELKITEKNLNAIFDQESKKTVGKACKRFEIPIETKKEKGEKIIFNESELIQIKKQVKELLYEALRDLRDIIRIVGKESIHLINKNK